MLPVATSSCATSCHCSVAAFLDSITQPMPGHPGPCSDAGAAGICQAQQSTQLLPVLCFDGHPARRYPNRCSPVRQPALAEAWHLSSPSESGGHCQGTHMVVSRPSRVRLCCWQLQLGTVLCGAAGAAVSCHWDPPPPAAVDWLHLEHPSPPCVAANLQHWGTVFSHLAMAAQEVACVCLGGLRWWALRGATYRGDLARQDWCL